MKTIKYILSTVLLLAVVWSCTKVEDNFDFVSTAQAPANITALYNITQDNTGLVTITPNGDGAISFDVTFGDNTAELATLKNGESVKHTYAEGNYQVKIAGLGVTGLKTEVTQDLVVSFEAPKNLVVVIENDQAVSKKVNVTANADFATLFDVYFGDTVDETPVSANIGETASFVYQNAGTYTIRVVAKGGAIATTEYTEEFEATEIMQPITAAPTPANRSDVDVISIFSDAYTNIVISEWNPGWGQSTILSEFDFNGDNILKYDFLNYTGIVTNYDNPTDLSGMEYVHFDYWTNDAESIGFKIVNTSQPDGATKESEVVITPDTFGAWVSVDILLSEYTTDMSAITQFVLSSNGVSVFIDNLYFYRAPSIPVKLPLTFDDDGQTFGTFNDASFAIDVDPEDANNRVGMITNAGGGWGWEGISLALDVPVNFSVNKTITMDFYTSTVPHKVLMKFEDTDSPRDGNNNPTVFDEVAVDVTTTGWSALSFEFASTVDYNSIVLFVDGGVEGVTGTYYIDNIEQIGASTGQIVFDDFEGNGNITTWFGDACGMDIAFANPYNEGINTSSTVLEYNDDGGTYANVRFDLPAGEAFDLKAKSSFSLKIYVASSDVAGSQPNQISLKLQDGTAGEPWTSQKEIIKTIILDTWQEITFDFANDKPEALSRTDFNRVVLQVNSEGNNDAVIAYIDDFSYGIATSVTPFDAGLITNGDFESGAEPWTIGVGTDPVPVVTDGGNSYYSVDVATAGQPYEVNASQKLEIIEGETYTLSFEAWSDTDRPILPGIGLSADPWTNITEEVNITTTKQTYTVTLIANSGASDARVFFDLGAAVGSVNIDNVSLFIAN